MKNSFLRNTIYFLTITVFTIISCKVSNNSGQSKIISKQKEQREYLSKKSQFSFTSDTIETTYREFKWQHEIIFIPEVNKYELRDLQRLGKYSEVICDSNGIISASYYKNYIKKKEIKAYYNSSGQIKEILTFNRIEDSMRVTKVEKFSYENSLLIGMDYEKISWQRRKYVDKMIEGKSTIRIDYKYDSLNRLIQKYIPRIDWRKNDYSVTTDFYYEGENTTPYRVYSNLPDSIEYSIKVIDDKPFEITKTNVSENLGSFSWYQYFKYYPNNQVSTFTKRTGNGSNHIYEFSYPEKKSLINAPRLLFQDPLIPYEMLKNYFTSFVEIQMYPDVRLITDLSFQWIPEEIIYKVETYGNIQSNSKTYLKNAMRNR
jgi:hypothetical protein